jgi:hypothetical protein
MLTIGGGFIIRAAMTAVDIDPIGFGPRGPEPLTTKGTGPAVLLKPVLSTAFSVALYRPGVRRTVAVMPVAVARGEPSDRDRITQP